MQARCSAHPRVAIRACLTVFVAGSLVVATAADRGIAAEQRARPRRPGLDAPEAGTVMTIAHAGLTRRYSLHTPVAGLHTPAPLVVVLHGGGAGGADDHVALIRQASRFDAKSNAEGFVVAYPEAVDGYWNDGRGLRRYTSQAKNIDDVGFIVAVVEHVAARMPIDRDRVFVTGASNGAMMAYRVACERSDRFTGVAAVAGNLPARLVCNPSNRLAVLIMNGTDDPLMPWAGGEVRFGPQRLGEVLSADTTAGRWASANGCDRVPVTDTLPDRAPNDGTRVVRSTFTSCRADVVLYRIEGGGHTWPGGPQLTGTAVVGRTSRDIDATEHMWDFFERVSQQRDRRPAAGPAFGTPFGTPMRVSIQGYDGNAMEPAISKDGQFLLFNDQNEPNPDKNLFWARRLQDDVFQSMGQVLGVNSSVVEASPSIDRHGVLFFSSLRNYPGRSSTLYQGRFAEGTVSTFAPVGGDLYRQEPRWVSLDPDVTPNGEVMYFAQGLFGGPAGPREMDIRLAIKVGLEYRLDPRANTVLAAINTTQHLEFAPAISADNLELFFTRGEKGPSGQVVALHILRATRARETDPFDPPAIVEPITGFVEAPSLSSDGRTLYFHKKDAGRFFIYRTTRAEAR